MRIALISFHFSEYSFLLANALAKEHDVLLIVEKGNADKELGRRLAGFKSTKLSVVFIQDRGLKNPLMLYNLFRVYLAVNSFLPDVIHCQETINDYLMGALLLLRKLPLVLTIHDHIPHSGKDARGRKRIEFYRKYLRKIPDGVIVHGEKIKKETEQLMPWLSGKTWAVPHGILSEVQIDDEFAWEEGCLLFFGRIEAYKGLGYFINVVKKLNSEGIKVKGIIAGTGEDLDKYFDEVSSSPLFELLDRYIAEDEVSGLFARANIVVLPYTDATQSGVVAMALSYGRPVVSTLVGSLDEVVRDGYNGFTVPVKDTNALTSAVRTLIEDQELSVKMAKNAINLAVTEMSWSEIAKKTINVYELSIHKKHKADNN